MESIWILPIYVIIPFIGLLISIIGFIRFKRGKGKKLIFPGLFLLCFPFFHMLLLNYHNNDIENKLVGEYSYGDLSHALKIYDDGKFKLERGYLYNVSGNGTWETQTIDFPILILDFGKGHEKWLEIKNVDNKIFLSSIGADTTFTWEFEKN